MHARIVSDWEPGVVLPLVVAGGLYARGVMQLWSRGVGRAVRRWEAAAFVAGWAALAVALVSPLHSLSEQMLAAHMVQHELLIVVAAPLIVLGRPSIVMPLVLPPSARRVVGRIARRVQLRAFDAWLLHAVAIWIWHAPRAFDAAVRSDAVHALQHLSFLGTALVFWWTLLEGTRRRATRGAGVIYLFTTATHTGVLGALMTFSRTLWYPVYSSGSAAWHLTPLEDQQLAGMIMWIPGSVAYLVAALGLMATWLRDSERVVARREAY